VGSAEAQASLNNGDRGSGPEWTGILRGRDRKNKTCERVPAAGPERVQPRLVNSEGSEQGYKKSWRSM